ncbi:MAG: serine/threonine protein kinase [Gemmataceae bacterium]|nr:serine/threonine protein kinase [Gemmataceae bacterium]
MKHTLFAFVIVWLISPGINHHVAAQPKNTDAQPIVVGPNDWPWWRGPDRNGIADAKQKPPLKWSDTENVLWKAPVPGRGHGSPIVVGDQIFLATADPKEETQSVLCYDRKTGKLDWQTEVHRGGFEKGGNGKSSLASATVACDGQRVFINFLHKKAIYTTALSRAGKQLWQTKVADYVLHQGFASSPAVYQSLVLVSADNKGTGMLAALERSTGKVVWTVERPKLPNYASPTILKVAGREQLFFIGCKLVTSLDPLTGRKLWETEGSTEECVTSTVTDGKLIITSGGYPKNHVAAVHADGSGKTAWEIKTKVYVPSMLENRGYLYAVQDEGVTLCWKFDTGKEVWKGRVDGPFSASPVLVGDHIFATNEVGRTFIFKASPAAFELIAENQLVGEVLATPTICGGRIYLRVAVNQKGQRQEALYCVGTKE